MARNLYRVYLYVVSIGSLIIAAVGAYFLLSLLFAETPLRGTFRPAPGSQELVQRIVLAVVLWAVAGALGGLHYWLIRRDMRTDPAAGSGAIRAFFLNFFEAVAVIVAVSTAASVLNGIAFGAAFGGDASDPLAVAVAAFAAAVVLEVERRRTRAGSGVARIFQRLHLYGVPLVLLLIAGMSAWQSAVRETIALPLHNAGQLISCPSPSDFTGPFPEGPCYTQVDIVPLWGAALLVLAAWGVYALFVRGDVGSALRQVLHLIGFTLGLIFLLVGVERGVEFGLRGLLGGASAWVDLVGPYEFVSALTFGLLVTLVYGLWLRREAALLPMGAATTGLTVEAIAALGLSVPFWWGLGSILHTAIESWVAPAGVFLAPDWTAWAFALALLITGIGSIPAILDLHRRTARTSITGPHRAFVFGSLAAGALTGAVGAAIALYALGTNLLGAGVGDWQGTARTGAVVFVIGIAIAGIYGWLGARLRYFKRAPATVTPEAAPVPPRAPDTIEAVLDAFASGKLARDEAAARIHEIDQRPLLPA